MSSDRYTLNINYLTISTTRQAPNKENTKYWDCFRRCMKIKTNCFFKFTYVILLKSLHQLFAHIFMYSTFGNIKNTELFIIVVFNMICNISTSTLLIGFFTLNMRRPTVWQQYLSLFYIQIQIHTARNFLLITTYNINKYKNK